MIRTVVNNTATVLNHSKFLVIGDTDLETGCGALPGSAEEEGGLETNTSSHIFYYIH